MSKCVDNPRLGRVGCGATYGGEMQHSVARVPWSRYPDGMAHVTAKLGTIDSLWKGDEMRDPAERGYVQDARGVWRRPISDEQRAALAERRAS